MRYNMNWSAIAKWKSVVEIKYRQDTGNTGTTIQYMYHLYLFMYHHDIMQTVTSGYNYFCLKLLIHDLNNSLAYNPIGLVGRQ